MSDKTPREWALQLPPDVLEHPMPFPHRLDYAEAIIRRAQNQATAALRSQRDELAWVLRRLVDEHESFYVDWALLNSESPDFDPGYKPEFPPVVHEVRAILAKLEEKQ